MPDCVQICMVEKDSKQAEELLMYVENCSWYEAREHIAANIRNWVYKDWEKMIIAVCNGKIVGIIYLLPARIVKQLSLTDRQNLSRKRARQERTAFHRVVRFRLWTKYVPWEHGEFTSCHKQYPPCKSLENRLK